MAKVQFFFEYANDNKKKFALPQLSLVYSILTLFEMYIVETIKTTIAVGNHGD